MRQPVDGEERVGVGAGAATIPIIEPDPSTQSVAVALVVANTINVGADIGAIAAAVNLLVPIPTVWMIVPIALSILGLQFFGSYRLISRIFKWLTLALFAYIGSAFFARPDLGAVL